MARPFEETKGILEKARGEHDAVLVAFSGGKDSRAVLELCVSIWPRGRVQCFFMELLPGLRTTEELIAYVRERYGLRVALYQHWLTVAALRAGTYCATHRSTDDIPPYGVRDVYRHASADAGVSLIATGMRSGDYMFRASNAHNLKTIQPIVGWNKFDVVAFLKARGIPLPPSSGRSATGVDLSVPSLLWLHDEYPDDFEKVCGVFPFARATFYRREWFGVA